jgi:hypothetical protein
MTIRYLVINCSQFLIGNRQNLFLTFIGTIPRSIFCMFLYDFFSDLLRRLFGRLLDRWFRS